MPNHRAAICMSPRVKNTDERDAERQDETSLEALGSFGGLNKTLSATAEPDKIAGRRYNKPNYQIFNTFTIAYTTQVLNRITLQWVATVARFLVERPTGQSDC